VSAEELERIEAQVNAVIRQNSDTTTRLMATDQAIAAGAEALLGTALSATRVACASFAAMPAVMEECASLQETASSLKDRLKDKMSRKKLAYRAYTRQTGKLGS